MITTAQDWRPALFDRALSGLLNCVARKGRNHELRTKSHALTFRATRALKGRNNDTTDWMKAFSLTFSMKAYTNFLFTRTLQSPFHYVFVISRTSSSIS